MIPFLGSVLSVKKLAIVLLFWEAMHRPWSSYALMCLFSCVLFRFHLHCEDIVYVKTYTIKVSLRWLYWGWIVQWIHSHRFHQMRPLIHQNVFLIFFISTCFLCCHTAGFFLIALLFRILNHMSMQFPSPLYWLIEEFITNEWIKSIMSNVSKESLLFCLLGETIYNIIGALPLVLATSWSTFSINSV